MSGWTPVDISGKNFYGNGHTVAINGLNTSTNMGLFGVVDGGTVRDVTMRYNSVIINRAAVTSFGGITGNTTGDAKVINVLVKGAVTVTKTGSGNLLAGGLIGNMSNAATIQNSYSGINITVTKTGTGDVFLGGVVGDTATGGTSTRKAIDGITTTGNITLTQTNGITYFGGIAGRTQASVTFNEINYTGALYANKIDDSGESYIGGITGYVNNSNYLDCIFTGTINTPETFEGEEAYLGGLWGYYNADDNAAVATDCWANGDITFNGNTEKYIGGAVGYIYADTNALITMKNCYYERGSITVSGTNTGTEIIRFYAGGFSGRIGKNTNIENCYSMARTVTVNFNNSNTGYVYAGGFVGNLDGATLSKCYAIADVYVESSGNRVQVGGFASALFNEDSILSACYAKGDVTAINTGNTSTLDFAVGGFIGSIYVVGRSTIDNCYALGSVTAEKIDGSGNINAGGITGNTYGGNTINRCFFGGTVTAIRNNNGNINAGGIVGYIAIGGSSFASATLTNNISLCTNITALGGTTRNVGRIWGYGGASNTSGNNYALDTMRIEKSNTHTTIFFPFWDGTTTEPATNYHYPTGTLTDMNGANTASSVFNNSSLWTRLSTASPAGLGFNSPNSWIKGYDDSNNPIYGAMPLWDFSRISRGYPTIIGLAGQ